MKLNLFALFCMVLGLQACAGHSTTTPSLPPGYMGPEESPEQAVIQNSEFMDQELAGTSTTAPDRVRSGR
jgi:hypothetical protein